MPQIAMQYVSGTGDDTTEVDGLEHFLKQKSGRFRCFTFLLKLLRKESTWGCHDNLARSQPGCLTHFHVTLQLFTAWRTILCDLVYE